MRIPIEVNNHNDVNLILECSRQVDLLKTNKWAMKSTELILSEMQMMIGNVTEGSMFLDAFRISGINLYADIVVAPRQYWNSFHGRNPVKTLEPIFLLQGKHVFIQPECSVQCDHRVKVKILYDAKPSFNISLSVDPDNDFISRLIAQ